MSKYNSIPSQFTSDLPVPTDRVLSKKQQLAAVQRSAEIIYDMMKELCIPNQCIFTAIQIVRRFFRVPSNKTYDLSVIRQAAVFLACKIENNSRSLQEIYESAAKLLKFPISALKCNFQGINLHKKDILDYEDILIRTLGFEMLDCHPITYIDKAIGKISNTTLSKTIRDDFKSIAYYLAKQSILQREFCIKYPADLIASFSVQFSSEINNMNIEPDVWLDKSITSKQVQKLIVEFSRIFVKCPADEKEKSLYRKVHQKALDHVYLLGSESPELDIFGENDSAHLSSSTDVTSLQSSSISSSTSLALSSSLDYSNHRTSISIQLGRSVRTKRPRASSPDNSNRKRSSTTQ